MTFLLFCPWAWQNSPHFFVSPVVVSYAFSRDASENLAGIINDVKLEQVLCDMHIASSFSSWVKIVGQLQTTALDNEWTFPLITKILI
jgi:hypothetical protein